MTKYLTPVCKYRRSLFAYSWDQICMFVQSGFLDDLVLPCTFLSSWIIKKLYFWHRKYKKRVEQGFKQDLHSHMPGFSHRVLWKMCFFFSASFRRRLRSQKSLGSCEIRLQIVQNRSSAADPSVFIIGSRYYPPLAHASITAASWYKSDGGN